MFRTDEQIISSFLLYFLEKGISSGIGLSTNGQPRGLSTRIMIDVIEWRALKRTALEHPNSTFAAEWSRKISIVMTPEPKIVTKIEPYDAAYIKRILGQKHSQSRMFERISNFYSGLAELQQTNMSVENEKLDMLETIKCLEATIKRLQRGAEGKIRRISANKGQLTRRLNALALETANINVE